jgi:hypothetical protein
MQVSTPCSILATKLIEAEVRSMEAYTMMDKVSYGIFLLLDSKLLFGPVTPARAGVVHRRLRCNHGEHNGEGVPHRPPPPPPRRRALCARRRRCTPHGVRGNATIGEVLMVHVMAPVIFL